MNTFKITFSSLLLFFSINTFSQTGPGGVGNSIGTNGQPANVIWFSANSLSLSDGNPVTTWTDISGNSNEATQVNVNQQPIFKTGQINGLPAIQFIPTGGAGYEDYMPFDGNLIANSDYTVIFVGKRRTNSTMKVFMGGTTMSTNQNLHLYWYNATEFRAHQYGNDLQTAMVPNTETYSSGTDANEFGIFTTLLSSGDATAQRRNYQNNFFLGSRSNSSKLSSWNGAAIGRYGTSYNDVDAAEIIIFSKALNDAQLQIVNQYLEIKYGITIYNDLYSPLVAYQADIAGIGEEANGEHSVSSSGGMYLTATSGLNIGDYIFTSHDTIANSPYRSNIEITASGSQEALGRTWYIEKINTPEAQISFDFSDLTGSQRYPSEFTNYTLLFRSGTTGDFTKIQNADGVIDGDKVYFNIDNSELQSGYYTLGTENTTNSPLSGVTGRTWYSLITGEWDNWETWTLDPSGSLPVNPDQLTPTNSPTSIADKVFIINGKTVTINPASPTADNKTNASLTVNGRLDINTTTGHNFGLIKGSGRILLKGDNFPTGDATDFISEGQGEGTVVYEGGNYDLNTARTFFDVEVILQNTTDTITLLNDYTLNGSLTVINGQFRINNDVNTTILNLNVNKNVLVEANGKIITGLGDTRNPYQIGGTMPVDNGKLYHSIFHQFNVGGDFTNNGIVKLTNLNAPDYNSFPTNGAVTLTFTNTSNNTFTVNNSTILYNLLIDKGTDKTYILEIISNSVSNFALFGANSVGRNTPTGFTTENPQIRKALFIKNGTLKLNGSILIPSLSEGGDEGGNGDYGVGKNSRFWIYGLNVTVYSTASNLSQITGYTATDTYQADGVNTGESNQAMSLYGEFKITNGFFGTRNSAGFIFWSDAYAQLKVEGGNINVAQLRTAYGGSGVCSYIQSGGIMTVRGNETEPGEITTGYPAFDLEGTTGVFIMSGGEILLEDIGGTNTNGFFVNSEEGNYNVTGGKVTINIASGNDFEFGSTAPVWDLEIKRLSGTGTSLVRLTKDMKVLNDLKINANCLLDAQDDLDATNYNLYVGRNFDLQDGGQYSARTNTTYFTGNLSSTIYVRNTTNAGELKFNNINIYKDQRYTTTLFHGVIVSSTGRTATLQPIEILGNFNINRGEFDYNRWDIHAKGNIEILDGRIFETDTPNGKIVLNGTALQTIKGAYGSEQDFGNFQLNNSTGAKLLSDINVTNFILSSGIMDLDIYNLDVAGSTSTTGTYSSTLMFKTAGNASDGGLTRYIDLALGVADASTLFPVGTTGQYTPAQVIQSATLNDAGKYTIIPVNTSHPAVTNPSKTIPYYWVVKKSGFPTISNTNIKYTFTYPGTISASLNKGAHLYDVTYEWDEFNSAVSDHDINFPYDVLLTGDYTVGNKSDFNKPTIYYSRGNQGFKNWSDLSTWSLTGHDGVEAGSLPNTYDIVDIGYATGTNQYHWVIMNTNNTTIAQVIFSGDGTTWNPRLYINAGNTQNLTKVTGRGDIRLYVTPGNIPTVNGDLGDFLEGIDNTFAFHIQADGQVNVTSNIKVYPNLRIEAGGGTLGNRIISFKDDILIKRNFTIDGNSKVLIDNETYGNITVNKDTYIGGYLGGQLQFPTSGPNKLINIYGNLQIRNTDANNSITVLNTTPSNLVHKLQLGGSLVQNQGTIDLFSDNTGGNNTVLELTGETDQTYTFTTGNTPQFYRIVINKLEGKKFTFDNAFTLNGLSSGTTKALTLISGDLFLQSVGIDITLSSGGANFKIPSVSSLSAQYSTLRISGDNTGIWLDGKISVGYSSQWLLNEGNNNYIEYTSSGNSEIQILQGTLKVGSQIRRNLYTEEGILNFHQDHSNSTVIIGTDNSIPANDRSVFEIFNNGSNFYQIDNAKIIIANAQDNARFPSVYLSPQTYSLGAGSEIQFGNSDTRTTQTIGLFTNINLKNISINNSSANNPKVKIWYKEITVDQNLSIATLTELNSDGWNLTVNGNWTNNGLYKPAGNTTYFSGSLTQEITGITEFYNFQKTNTNIVNVNSNLTITNEFHLLAGTLDDKGNEISVYGNLFNSGTHVWGNTGDGIKIIGTTQQEMTSTGVWGKITLNNPEGILIPTDASAIIVNNAVKLHNGVFNIGRNLLVLNENANFIEANPYSETNMVQTNISFTDNGIKKLFAEGYSGNFVYPIGSEGKYTPVEFDITSTDAGSIRIKAANEKHPTIVNDVEPCNEIVDSLNVLQYHWVLEAENITNFNAEATMKYYSADALVTSPYDLNAYITAKLLAGTTSWNKYSTTSFDEANNLLRFTFANNDSYGINGDYTAGVEDPAGTCKGAIPDEIPVYISIATGNWTDYTKWDTYPVSGGIVPVGGPRGAIAIIQIGDTIISAGNYLSNYKTTINGVLNIGTTYGHRLGVVDGAGELYIERGDLPAAVYDNFIKAGSGTFNFGGIDNYDVMSELPIVNNIKFSGTGERRFPNLDVVLQGFFKIEGIDNTLLVVNEHDRKISVMGEITFNSGSFDAGMGTTAIFETNGNATQSLSGTNTFTGSNAFNYFLMNNPSTLIINKTIEINQNLTFSAGVILNNGVNLVKLNSSLENVVIGADVNKYVDGAVSKNIQSGGNFIFPTGNAGRFGNIEINSATQSNASDFWTAQYFNYNPNNDGYNPDNFFTPLQYVSQNEYWKLNGPSGANSYIKLRWDENSGASTDATERDAMRIAEWISANTRWEAAHSTNTASGTATSGTITTNPTSVSLLGNHYFTLGTNLISDNTWEGDISSDWNTIGNWTLNKVPTSTTNSIIPTTPVGGRFPLISTTANACKLTIQSSAIVIINAGNSLTLTGNFVNNGTLTLKSPANSGASASFIDNGNISGTGTYQFERYFTGGAFHYVSAPISGGNAASALFTTHPSGNFNPNFFKYNEALDIDGNPLTAPAGAFDDKNMVAGWLYAYNDRITSVPMEAKRAYAFYTDIDQLKTFIGTPNTGNQNITNLNYTANDIIADNLGTPIPELYDGWNLVANPYPSAIDWNLIKNDLQYVDEGIYVWNGTQYSSYVNGISGGSGNLTNLIAPMQGFFVRANNSSNPGAFSLNNSHRKHSAEIYLKSTSKEKATINNIVKLQISANGYVDNNIIYFTENATDDWDGRYDALCLFAQKTNIPNFYSITKSQTRLTINGLPEEQIGNTTVNLGVKVLTSGTYTISLKELNGFDNERVYLEDKYLNKTIDLKSVTSYTFDHTSGEVKDRFVLKFVENKAPVASVSVENKTTLEDEQFNYIVPSNLFVDNDENDFIKYSAKQISGEELPNWLSFNSETNSFTGTPGNNEVGIYGLLIIATDSYNASSSTPYYLEVVNTNDAPTVANQIINYEYIQNQFFNFTISENAFADIDKDDEIELSAVEQGTHSLPVWLSFDKGIFSGTPDNYGTFKITITATDKADASVSQNFEIVITKASDISEIENSNLEIYPNPSRGIFYIELNEIQDVQTIKVSGVAGKIIQIIEFSESYASLPERITIDIAKHSHGVYFVHIQTKNGTIIRRIIKD